VEQKPPDVIVLGPQWPQRALLRAQLIEEWYEVVAVDAWPIRRLYRRAGMKPRVLLIDLHELPSRARPSMKCGSSFQQSVSLLSLHSAA
jgi:hypothetical protein